MSTLTLTKLQSAILGALSTHRELSNAQVAAAAKCSEGYASRVLSKLRVAGMARSRLIEDAEDSHSHFRLWKRV